MIKAHVQGRAGWRWQELLLTALESLSTWTLPGVLCYNQYKSKGCQDQALLLGSMAALRSFWPN